MLNILGSCVTRDAFELCESMKINKYVARQSLICAASTPISDQLFNQIIFKNSTSYIERIISEDAKKNYFVALDHKIPLIIDLIDERFCIFKISHDSYLTYSTIAKNNTNLGKFAKNFIYSYTDLRINMFFNSMSNLKNRLDKRKILIHWALYDEVVRDKTLIILDKLMKNMRMRTYILKKCIQFCLTHFTMRK